MPIGVTFGPWCPLAEAPLQAPARPGVAQLRQAEGLRSYPRGKSAMVHYAAAADLQALATELAAAHPTAPWWWRHSQEAISDDQAHAELAALRRLFVARFGAAPAPGP